MPVEMRKTILRLIAAWCLLLSTPSQAGPEDPLQGRLWRVETPTGAVGHLFGTMHVGDPRVTHLPPAIQQAFEQSTLVVTELPMDFSTMARAMESLFYQDGRTLDQLVDKDTYAAIEKRLAVTGIKQETVRNMNPLGVMSSMGVPGTQAGVALDMQLYVKALRSGKRVAGLESVDEQLAVFDQLSIEAQQQLLKSLLQDYDVIISDAEELKSLYLQGDLDGMWALSQQELDTPYGQFMREFIDLAIVQRNHRMHQRLKRIMQEQGVFVAVGALHLPGPEGLIRLLRASGYTVEAVNVRASVTPPAEEGAHAAP